MTTERTIMMQPRELELLRRLEGEWDLEIKAKMPDVSLSDLIAKRHW